jgi:hypothetical protein
MDLPETVRAREWGQENKTLLAADIVLSSRLVPILLPPFCCPPLGMKLSCDELLLG